MVNSSFTCTEHLLKYIFFFSASMEFSNSTKAPNSTCFAAYEETRVYYAYLISAILILIASIGYMFLYCKMNKLHSRQQRDSIDTRKDTPVESTIPINVKAVILILLASLMMSYSVMEKGFSDFLMTFVLNRLNWSKETGSFLTTIFWACFTIGRFAGIFIVGHCKQSTMLTLYLGFIALSSFGFMLGTVFNVFPLIWIFTGTLGFSMSVVFPCIFGWTSENILNITGKISSLFLVSAGLGGILFPLLVGYLMEYFSPLWFVYMLMIFTGVAISIYLLIRLITHACINKRSNDTLMISHHD